MSRLADAFKAFWSTLKGPCPQEVKARPASPVLEKDDAAEKQKVVEKEKKNHNKLCRESFEAGALYTLTLLQREGRLIDFLMESVDSYEDSQIGAAVRRIHYNCHRSLKEYFKLKRIVEIPEGGPFDVDGRLDRGRVKLVGHVPDMIPFKGVVQHCGWEAAKLDLPERNDSISEKVIYQAEVGF